MNLFTKFWRPLNLYRRDAAFYARHAAGDISSRDIIEIEYGGAMPRGWNVTEKPHQHAPVAITTPLTDKRSGLIARLLMSVMALGYVNRDATPQSDIEHKAYPGKPAIALNKLIFSPAGQGGMLYLIHGLVTTVAAYAALGPVAIARRYPLLAMMAVTSLRNQPLTQIFTLPFRPSMDTVGHENVHVLQNRDPYETKTGHNIFRNSFKNKFNEAAAGGSLRSADSLLSLGLASYFRNDYEIQARMNTLLTHNYARWGRMPETRHEIWAALVDAGLRAPASIHRALAESGEDLSAFRKSTVIGRIGQQLFAPHIAELNTAYWGLYSPQSREEYWHDTLPYLYGHLTELCGDQGGLAKMGYTGPVVDGAGPAPAAPEAREKFWRSIKGDFTAAAMHVKTMEAERGIILRDNFNDPSLDAPIAAAEHWSPAVTLLRQTHRGTAYMNRQAPA